MSLLQLKPFLRSIDKDERIPTYYFMYDHQFSIFDFHERFGVTPFGVAWLPGWTWHINTQGRLFCSLTILNHSDSFNDQELIPTLGKANVRYTFMENPHCHADTPPIAPARAHIRPKFNGTYGYLYILTPELKAKLASHYAASRIPMTPDISAPAVKHGRRGRIRTKALAYYDPWYTADSNISMMDDVNEAKKWTQGLMALSSHGAPLSWIVSVQNHLAGLGSFKESEPLRSAFRLNGKPSLSR